MVWYLWYMVCYVIILFLHLCLLCDVRSSHQINITYTHVSDIANYFKCNFSHLNTAIGARCMMYLSDIHNAAIAVVK